MLRLFFNRRGDKVIRPRDEKVEKRSSVYGVFKYKDKLLTVIPTWCDLWDLPGGAVENEETDLEALNREFKEETGYSIKKVDHLPFKVVKSNFYSDDDGKYYDSTMRFYMIASIDRRSISEIDREEIKKVVWLKIDMIKRRSTKNYLYDVVLNYLKIH